MLLWVMLFCAWLQLEQEPSLLQTVNAFDA